MTRRISPFALVVRLGQELLGRSQNRFRVGLHLDLRDRFDGNGHALLGVEILLRSYVERHQFEREFAADLHHGQHDRAMAFHHARPTQSVHDEGLVRPGFTIEPRHSIDQEQQDHHAKAYENPNHHYVGKSRKHNASCCKCSAKNLFSRESRIAGEFGPTNSEWAGCAYELNLKIE